MKIAIMQPYFFPYIGYFQLICSVDEYIFLDNVNFIKRGFINRNKILLQGGAFAFSIPVKNVSQNRKIIEHEYSGEFSLFLKKINVAYRKAPNFEEIYNLIEKICLDPDLNVARKNALGIQGVLSYLDVPFKIKFASSISINDELQGQDRIIALCKARGATSYANAIGGKDLYSRNDFIQQGIALSFYKADIEPYAQYAKPFVENLSIIDLLMFRGKDAVSALLSKEL